MKKDLAQTYPLQVFSIELVPSVPINITCSCARQELRQLMVAHTGWYEGASESVGVKLQMKLTEPNRF